MKPVTVPFFISHQGCPQTCVFCDQRLISGAGGRLPDTSEIIRKITDWRATAGERPLEVAFFGGSFTALPDRTQDELLAPLQTLLQDGTIAAIRLSTRPDCLDNRRIAYLANRGVRTIELGVQSMDDRVLSAAGRGHLAADSESAIRLIKKHGLTVGAQLMPGLPCDTPASSCSSLDRVAVAGADFIRIYPALVLRGTELARRYTDGSYAPLSLEKGVQLCKLLLQRAMRAGLEVVRIGLQADEGLNADTVLAGCWHPALGHLVRAQLYGDLLSQMLSGVSDSSPVSIKCHPRRLSDVIGPARANLEQLKRKGILAAVTADEHLAEEELAVEVSRTSPLRRSGASRTSAGTLLLRGSVITDLHYSIHEV